jgi:glutamyl-tRNA synthetase
MAEGNREKQEKIVTRFAPSPTGFMHIGGVRTALFAWLWARKNDGTFILRIEDTDKEREVAGSIEHIQKSLAWLGIEWDFGPDKPGPFGSCIQSERLDTYREYAQKLIDKGLAYPDPYTQAEIEVFRKQAEAEKRPFLFRNHRPEKFDAWDGKQSLRFKVPEIKRYKWHDIARGDLEAGEEALDDFILMKGDGYPTYNFAHIIDDLNMGVTHILRGDEFISSTPRFLSLYDALEIKPPIFATLPPILRDDRTKKLGKRDGAKDILEYQTEGYLPEAMMNFLALIGWNPGGTEEIMNREELIRQFSLEKIQKSGGAFNEEKLAWMNKEYMAKLSDAEFLKLAAGFLPKNFSDSMLPLIREKIQVVNEIPILFSPEGELSFVSAMPEYKKEALMWKKDGQQAGPAEARFAKTKAHIEAVIKMLESLSAAAADFTSEKIKAAIWPYAEAVPAEAGGRGSVLWPMRYALSGKEKSPDPFIMSAILGKTETLRRLQSAVDILSA